MKYGSVRTALAAMLCALAVPAAAQAADYVAMGDSFASGTGTRTYYEGCERSVYAYPYLIKGSLGSTFTFIACGGARTQDVLNNQVSRLDAGTEYVTISIGGNDAGFSSVITECAKPVLPFTSNPCTPAVNNAQSFIQNTLPGRLDNVYDQIRDRAPNAIVAVVGYPRLFNGEDCNAATFFSGDELTRLNQTADLLANVTRARAAAHGFSFVDSRQAFVGHAVCDDPEWLNGLSNPISESYHPNRTGHSQGFAPMVRATLLAAPSPNAPVGGNGRIAFTSTRDGNDEIYAMNGDGAAPANLTNHPASDVDAAYSPDGTKLAFASNRDGDYEIFVAAADGSNPVQLTANASVDREPTWSPNGELIAFRSDRTGNNEIFRMSASGASQTNLTNNGASDFAPDWSPDGAEIAWQRFTSGGSTGQGNEVFKSNADGQGQLNLTNNAASINDGGAEWSPNGTTIAFHSNRDGDFEVFTMASTGGAATQRTSNTASDGNPTWAPNGALLAFTSNRDGNDEIYTMTPTGGSQVNRSARAGGDSYPSWQADSAAPATTITDGPSGPTNEARPTFTFSASEIGSSLQCRVDGAPFAACTSPHRTAALAEGEHRFEARAVDPAGNVDTTPAARTFLVDLTAPEVELTCPSTVLLDEDATATVDVTDEGSGLPDGEDPSGDHPLDTSEPGERTFTVDAFDRAGNKGTAECTYLVAYPDPGAPELSDGGSPNAGAFALAWAPSGSERFPLTYVLQRRDAASEDWQEVAAGLTSPGHAFTYGGADDEGTWTYRVKGVDADRGLQTSWSEVSAPVVVDGTAPHAPALAADRAPEHAGDGGWFRDAVTVTATDQGDPALRDGSAPSGVDPASVPAPRTLTETGAVSATVRDLVGHESEPAELRVQVDATAPSLALDCPASVVLGGRADVTVRASDGESGLAQDPSGTVAVDTSRVGTRTIERTAIDHVGHRRTERCEVLVRYEYGGLEKPVERDGTGVHKAGSTIPLKTAITDASGAPVATAKIAVKLERLSGPGDDATVVETVDGTATNGKPFAYDAGSRSYQFNLSTKGLAAGTWRIRLDLDDGTSHRTPITLR